jgi:hypothetical protein
MPSKLSILALGKKHPFSHTSTELSAGGHAQGSDLSRPGRLSGHERQGGWEAPKVRAFLAPPHRNL